jgi:hypothetical protein
MYGIYENGRVIARFTAPLTLRSNQAIFSSDTLSLKRYTVKRSPQRWELEAGLEPLTSEAAPLMTHIITSGYDIPVTIVTPQNYGVIKRRVNTGTPLASASVGASVVSIAGTNGLVPAGTFIRFSNHSKVYMTTEDYNNPLSSGLMKIYPSLVQSVNNVDMFCNDDVIMTCFYDTDMVRGMVYRDGIMMDVGTAKLVEKL